MRNIIKASAFVLLLLMVTACGSKKAIVGSSGSLESKSKKQLISDVLNEELRYKAISGKVDIEFQAANSKKGFKTGSFMKLVRDSVLQISIRPFLGVEAMRLTLTPDSVFMIDRYNKKYAAESMTGLSSKIVFNYYNLQSLLTNALFLPGQQNITEDEYKNYDVDIASGMYLAKVKDKSGILYNFAIDASDRIASTLIFSPEKLYTLQWSYNDFIKDANNIYPTSMTANVEVKDMRMDVKISYQKLDIDKEVKIDYSVPNKYEKSSIRDIIKAYMK
ncbi:DUF4292 domain-containing protein [Dysgonomonas sp. 216]|uniref:DUF4292 domain-containing protein n=1 Tax=Dysgonomonas sp. 216 TaxID=2302934 RepID=UPI0013D5E406|nr:DUF4292 domain-containing protein [Dysgonomonas sp. 216]NDW17705.1 DUF4292 domain-containing protein [Dysgonomonas sp. 216]